MSCKNCEIIENQNKILKDLLIDVLDQTCGIRLTEDKRVVYDHSYLSAYQNALRELLSQGLIKEDQLYRSL
jgi:hypothetical protein